VIGFAGMGLGLASIEPILFRAAGRLPGLAPAIGSATVSTAGRFGFLAGPPLMGLVTKARGLPVGPRAGRAGCARRRSPADRAHDARASRSYGDGISVGPAGLEDCARRRVDPILETRPKFPCQPRRDEAGWLPAPHCKEA
jgi:hypothetical protein